MPFLISFLNAPHSVFWLLHVWLIVANTGLRYTACALFWKTTKFFTILTLEKKSCILQVLNVDSSWFYNCILETFRFKVNIKYCEKEMALAYITLALPIIIEKPVSFCWKAAMTAVICLQFYIFEYSSKLQRVWNTCYNVPTAILMSLKSFVLYFCSS